MSVQESLIRFSKFLQENDAKRARAERKALDENKQAKLKAKEIDSLHETLEALKEEKEQTLEVLDKNLKYQQYLEHVLEVRGDKLFAGDRGITENAILLHLEGRQGLLRMAHTARRS